MHRFFVSTDRISGGLAYLSADQQRQIKSVLRLGPGDVVAVFDGSGCEFTATLESDGAGSLAARIVETRRPRTEPQARITLVQGLPKGEKTDLILQKCTEIGVAEFIITTTARSVPRIPSDRIPSRLERWRAIVREAAEQSGRVCVPSVHGVLPFQDALARVKGGGRMLIAWEEEKEVTLQSALGDPAGWTDVAYFVGPEGGFTLEEISAAREAGAIPVSLGARTLRTETAAVAGCALIIYGQEHATHPSTTDHLTGR